MPSERRVRLLVAATAAMAAVVTAGLGAAIAEKLDIDAVQASSRETALTVFIPRAAPQAPKPPPPVKQTSDAAAGGAATQRTPAEARPKSSPAAAPLDDASAPTRGADLYAEGDGEGVDYTGGLPAGTQPIGKAGRCVVPPCGETPITRAAPPPVLAPLAKIKAQGIFLPDPDPAQLAKTPTGMGSRSPGSVALKFCTGGNGKTRGVTITKSFGDRKVDEIARAAVKRWRFRPTKMNGRAVETCSEVTFRIVFD